MRLCKRIAGCETMSAMQHLPPKSSSRLMDALLTKRQWLAPADDFFRSFLARPELSPVPESCAAELALHAALDNTPRRPVAHEELLALKDNDARESYTHFLRFRDTLLAAGTLEAYYLQLFPRTGGGQINIPPLFVDMLVDAITHSMLGDGADAYEARASEILFRTQRISTQDGQVLCGDQLTLDMLNETGGLGDIGRFLAEAKAPMLDVNMQVLTDDNASAYFQQAAGRHAFLLDLTHEVTNDLSHGLVFTMTRARSGLKALASVLQKWVQHFLGVAVTIRPLQKIDDESWRWHVGLDVASTALLNDLYEGRDVEPERLQRLVTLFRLDFADPQDMRPDVAGKPVYLGLMMNADGIVKLKPQNLLVNLPLRALA